MLSRQRWKYSHINHLMSPWTDIGVENIKNTKRHLCFMGYSYLDSLRKLPQKSQSRGLYAWTFIKILQYIPRNMHTVFALLYFIVVIHWPIFPYPSGLLHWHCGNLTIAPVPAKQPWWIWINTSCEFIMNDCITTTKQSTTKPCAYFLGYTVDWAYCLVTILQQIYLRS